MADVSKFARSLDSPLLRFVIVAGFVLLVIASMALHPFFPNRIILRQSPVLQAARFLNIAMFAYSNDNKGAYPTGNSSTEIFQKLIDEGYIQDGSVLYIDGMKMKGKVKATSKKLKPENVCWDVTIPLDTNSPDQVPVVFSTGYRVNYVPNGSATRARDNAWSAGIAITYHSNVAKFAPAVGDTVPKLIDSDFPADGKKYVQLTPDGPLGP